MLHLEFMRLAFGAGIVVGLLAPAVGFFLVQRRLSLIGDGIGHVAFAGVALGYLLALPLVLTALVVSVLGALSIEGLRARRKAAGDQALALIFYTGIAGGVVLVSAAGALNVNLFQFLFGSILTVTRTDLAVIAGLGAGALALIAVLYRPLLAVVVDDAGARVSPLPRCCSQSSSQRRRICSTVARADSCTARRRDCGSSGAGSARSTVSSAPSNSSRSSTSARDSASLRRSSSARGSDPRATGSRR